MWWENATDFGDSSDKCPFPFPRKSRLPCRKGFSVLSSSSFSCRSRSIEVPHRRSDPLLQQPGTFCTSYSSQVHTQPRSSAVVAAPPVLARQLDIRVADAVMSRKRIGPAKRLLFRTEITPDLLLPRIVDGIFVPSKIVRAGKDRVAWLSRAGVDPVAAVGAGLRVGDGLARRRRLFGSPTTARALGLPVTFPLVFL